MIARPQTDGFAAPAAAGDRYGLRAPERLSVLSGVPSAAPVPPAKPPATPSATPSAAPSRSATAAPPGGPETALALHAALVSQPHSLAAAQAFVITLARLLPCTRVAVHWAQDLVLLEWARSDGAAAAPSGSPGLLGPRGGDDANARPLMLDAAAEAFDQSAAVSWPAARRDDNAAGPEPGAGPGAPLNAAVPRITRAHAALAGVQGSAATVLLVVRGQRVGALTVQRSAGPPVSPAELEQLEHLAGLSAPTLWLLQQNERSPFKRLRDAWRAGAGQRQNPHGGLRRLAWLCGAGALCAALWPWPSHVGGRARLEGAVQRVLAAPADGYLQHVHARAGDTVRAGQPLLELADQDLQLERQRWESQLAQHLDALASAQARADRSQLVLHQSRADEAQAQLALVDERLLRSRLVAPFDGIVVQGDWSQQLGAPVKEGTELLTLAPLDKYRVVIEIDERDLTLVQAGPSAEAGGPGRVPRSPGASGTLTLGALPWTTLPLRLTRMAPTAKAVEGRNVFEAEAELTLAAGTLPPGLRPGLQGTAHVDSEPVSPLLHLLRRSLGAARVAWWAWWG